MTKMGSAAPSKHFLDYIAIVVAASAMLTSIQSCRTTKAVADVTYTPRIMIENISVGVGTPIGEAMPESAIGFDVRNSGAVRATNVRIFEYGLPHTKSQADWVKTLDVQNALGPGDAPVITGVT